MKKVKVIALVTLLTATTIVGCGNDTNEELAEGFKVSEYKGIELIEPTAQEITEDAVEGDIALQLEGYAETTEITDRPVQDGDTVIIDYVGTKDGVAFDGGTAENAELVIGSNSFIEGFESGLIGAEVGETRDLDLTFPEEYGNEDLDGQAVVFEVTVNQIQEIVIPELSDELVKEMSEESETVEEYKEEVRAELEEYVEVQAEDDLKYQAVEILLANTEVTEYNEEKLNESIAVLEEQMTQQAAMYGMEVDELISAMTGGQTAEEYYDENAKNMIKEELMVNYIAEEEGIEFTEEEYQEEFQELAEEVGYASVEEVLEVVDEETLKQIVISDAVYEWVVDNAKIIAAEDVVVEEDTAEEDTAEEDEE